MLMLGKLESMKGTKGRVKFPVLDIRFQLEKSILAETFSLGFDLMQKWNMPRIWAWEEILHTCES